MHVYYAPTIWGNLLLPPSTANWPCLPDDEQHSADDHEDNPDGLQYADAQKIPEQRQDNPDDQHDQSLPEDRLLTIKEIAARFRVSKMTVYRMVHARELNAIAVGKSFRIPESEVHKYLKGREV